MILSGGGNFTAAEKAVLENCKTARVTNSRNCRNVRMFEVVWRCVKIRQVRAEQGCFYFCARAARRKLVF
jgi:hypothetical protein